MTRPHPAAVNITAMKQDPLGSAAQLPAVICGIEDYALFMLDPTGKIANWNSGAERIKGYEAGEIIGEHFCQKANVPAGTA